MSCNHTHHFDDERNAERQAEQLGMRGAHKMKCEDRTVWVPGNCHATYLSNMSGNVSTAGTE